MALRKTETLLTYLLELLYSLSNHEVQRAPGLLPPVGDAERMKYNRSISEHFSLIVKETGGKAPVTPEGHGA